MTIKDLKDMINNISSENDNVEVVGEICFKKRHGLDLHYAGMGQENKFVLFFKEHKEA